MATAGPVCFECDQNLSALERLRFKYFCSEKHKTDWLQEFNILGLLRLQEGAQSRFETLPPAAPAVSGAERRVAIRVELDAPVRVTLPDVNDTAHAARFVNASATGMKITMGSEAFAGMRIRVDCGDHAIVGEVRRCHTGDAGYVIALEITEWDDRRGLSPAAGVMANQSWRSAVRGSSLAAR
jgi:hypothetical protein